MPEANLIAKGYRVALHPAGRSRRFKRLPAGYAILHDPSGKDWPRCSILIAPFTRSRIPNVDNKEAVEYFNYEPMGGKFELPNKRLSEWEDLGEMDAITYIRPGDKEFEGEDNLSYGHEFTAEDGWFVFTKDIGYPRLYKRGRCYRLEFVNGCVINWRGFVFP